VSTAAAARPRTVLVTGGSRGIGAATARAAAREGWTVLIAYRRSGDAARQLVDEIAAGGGRAHALAADVGDDAQVLQLFEEVDRLGTGLDGLVNSAGVLGVAAPVDRVGTGDLLPLFRTNVFGLVACTREAVRRMSVRHGGRGGSIVHVSSTAARNGGMRQYAHYAATKGAIDSLTVAMALELGDHGIRVNAVRPGLIATEIHDSRGGLQALRPLHAQIPLGRLGEAAEVAESIVWLLSDRASYVHGTCLDVAGGR
jgi:NAD(P)-dependent dehydrogenase (short-subunit alcohol dehydrogenase family)